MDNINEPRSGFEVCLTIIAKAIWFFIAFAFASIDLLFALILGAFGMVNINQGSYFSVTIGLILVSLAALWIFKVHKNIISDYALFFLKRRIRKHAKQHSNGVLGQRSVINVQRKTENGKTVEGIYFIDFVASPGYTDNDVVKYLDLLKSNFGVNVYLLPDSDQHDGVVRCVMAYKDYIKNPLSEEAPVTKYVDVPADEPCVFGMDKTGSAISIPLYTRGQGGVRMTVSGRSGSGKNSPVTQLVLHAIAAGFDLYLCDPKQTELRYAATAAAMYETEPKQMLAVLRQVNKEMTTRQKIVADSGYNVWDVDKHGAPALLVVDEFTALTSASGVGLDKKEIAEAESLIVNLAQRARSAGVSLIFVTQQLSTNAMPSAARSNFDIRLSMSVATSADAEMAIPGSSTGDKEFDPSQIGGTYDRNGNLTTAGVFVLGGLFKTKGRSYYIPNQEAVAHAMTLFEHKTQCLNNTCVHQQLLLTNN